MVNSQLLIGASGFSYPHWGKGVFYPKALKAADWLTYYSRFFKTVELNNTFYRLPSKAMLTHWRMTTPPDFIFAVKASRYITHFQQLQRPEESTTHFLVRISILKEKLGPVLFQLPPSLSLSLDLLDDWLDVIGAQSQSLNLRAVLEVRHPSWLAPDVFRRLKKANIALCLADGAKLSVTGPLTADFIYIRRHGPVGASCYPVEMLQAEARRIVDWRKGGRDVYIYFNNDAFGYAVENAQQLKIEIDTVDRARVQIMNTFTNTPAPGFQEIDHTADWAYRVWADSLDNLFKQAADGLYDLAGMALTSEPQSTHAISLEAVDTESLLVAWLNELLYLHEENNLGVEAIPHFCLDQISLQATVVTRPVQQWTKDIKAATYNNLAIRSTDRGFEATLVLDV